MKRSYKLVGACVAAAVLAACGGGNNGLPSSTTRAGAQPLKAGKVKIIYRFQGGTDGEHPVADLIAMNGELYGTTSGGGDGCPGSVGCGTVFQVSTSGSESVLYALENGSDGEFPYGSLVGANGVLYGTTAFGGFCGTNCGGSGTVFAVSTSGSESIIRRFGGYPDGGNPYAGITAVNGVLYGTTSYGGTHENLGAGTVFEITTSGGDGVVYSFTGGQSYNSPDGAVPSASLTEANGALYGTTTYGGGTKCEGAGWIGCGTVFKITASGKERVLYRFEGGQDGAWPQAGLTLVNGKLYGTTGGGGGTYGSGGYSGYGTVFEVSTSGKERVLHRFGSIPDGEGPMADLIAVNGKLYGTTAVGGSGCSGTFGCGTVFEVSTSGKVYSVLYSFTGDKDGSQPRAGLTLVNGMLYGTTSVGGGFGRGPKCPEFGYGCGTVFEMKP